MPLNDIQRPEWVQYVRSAVNDSERATTTSLKRSHEIRIENLKCLFNELENLQSLKILRENSNNIDIANNGIDVDSIQNFIVDDINNDINEAKLEQLGLLQFIQDLNSQISETELRIREREYRGFDGYISNEISDEDGLFVIGSPLFTLALPKLSEIVKKVQLENFTTENFVSDKRTTINEEGNEIITNLYYFLIPYLFSELPTVGITFEEQTIDEVSVVFENINSYAEDFVITYSAFIQNPNSIDIRDEILIEEELVNEIGNKEYKKNYKVQTDRIVGINIKITKWSLPFRPVIVSELSTDINQNYNMDEIRGLTIRESVSDEFNFLGGVATNTMELEIQHDPVRDRTFDEIKNLKGENRRLNAFLQLSGVPQHIINFGNFYTRDWDFIEKDLLYKITANDATSIMSEFDYIDSEIYPNFDDIIFGDRIKTIEESNPILHPYEERPKFKIAPNEKQKKLFIDMNEYPYIDNPFEGEYSDTNVDPVESDILTYGEYEKEKNTALPILEEAPWILTGKQSPINMPFRFRDIVDGQRLIQPISSPIPLETLGESEEFDSLSEGFTMWVADIRDDKIYAYDNSTRMNNPGKEFNMFFVSSNVSSRGLWSDGETMWLSDSVNDKIFAYNLETKQRDEEKDFNTLNAAGNNAPQDIWSDGATMWVADSSDDKLYAYNMTTKQRDPSKDFNTLSAANDRPTGIWSNGIIMWIADSIDDKIYAYRMSNKQREESEEFNTLNAAGNNNPLSLWSDGTTMWVADNSDDKLYAYNITTKQRDPSKDFDTLAAVGNTSPQGIWSDGRSGIHTPPIEISQYSFTLDNIFFGSVITPSNSFIANDFVNFETTFKEVPYTRIVLPFVHDIMNSKFDLFTEKEPTTLNPEVRNPVNQKVEFSNFIINFRNVPEVSFSNISSKIETQARLSSGYVNYFTTDTLQMNINMGGNNIIEAGLLKIPSALRQIVGYFIEEWIPENVTFTYNSLRLLQPTSIMVEEVVGDDNMVKTVFKRGEPRLISRHRSNLSLNPQQHYSFPVREGVSNAFYQKLNRTHKFKSKTYLSFSYWRQYRISLVTDPFEMPLISRFDSLYVALLLLNVFRDFPSVVGNLQAFVEEYRTNSIRSRIPRWMEGDIDPGPNFFQEGGTQNITGRGRYITTLFPNIEPIIRIRLSFRSPRPVSFKNLDTYLLFRRTHTLHNMIDELLYKFNVKTNLLSNDPIIDRIYKNVEVPVPFIPNEEDNRDYKSILSRIISTVGGYADVDRNQGSRGPYITLLDREAKGEFVDDYRIYDEAEKNSYGTNRIIINARSFVDSLTTSENLKYYNPDNIIEWNNQGPRERLYNSVEVKYYSYGVTALKRQLISLMNRLTRNDELIFFANSENVKTRKQFRYIGNINNPNDLTNEYINRYPYTNPWVGFFEYLIYGPINDTYSIQTGTTMNKEKLQNTLFNPIFVLPEQELRINEQGVTRTIMITPDLSSASLAENINYIIPRLTNSGTSFREEWDKINEKPGSNFGNDLENSESILLGYNNQTDIVGLGATKKEEVSNYHNILNAIRTRMETILELFDELGEIDILLRPGESIQTTIEIEDSPIVLLRPSSNGIQIDTGHFDTPQSHSFGGFYVFLGGFYNADIERNPEILEPDEAFVPPYQTRKNNGILERYFPGTVLVDNGPDSILRNGGKIFIPEVFRDNNEPLFRSRRDYPQFSNVRIRNRNTRLGFKGKLRLYGLTIENLFTGTVRKEIPSFIRREGEKPITIDNQLIQTKEMADYVSELLIKKISLNSEIIDINVAMDPEQKILNTVEVKLPSRGQEQSATRRRILENTIEIADSKVQQNLKLF